MDRVDALFVRAPRFYTDGVTSVIFPEEALYPTILEKNGFIARFLNPEIVERRFQPQLYPKKDTYVAQDKLLKDFINNESHPRWRFLSFYIKKLMPKVVFISRRHPSDFSVTLKTAEMIKKINPNIFIISIHNSKEEAKIYLKNSRFIDVCTFGEPEYTILEVMKKYKRGNLERSGKIKGIVIRNNDKIASTKEREIEINLDKFPIPDRDLVIRKEWYPPSAFGLVEVSRGCIYSCNFCELKPPLKVRSPELVVKEIMLIMKKYKTREFKLLASSMLHDINWMKKFCTLIKKSKLKFVWGGYVNLNQINEDLIKCMKSSGLIEVGSSIESGSINILYKFNKLQNARVLNNQYDSIIHKIGVLKKNGVLWRTGIIFGVPGERKSDVAKSINVIRRLKPDFFRFQFLIPKIETIWFNRLKVRNKGELLDKFHTGYSFFIKGKKRMLYYALWSKMEKLSSISEKNYLLKKFLNPRVLLLKTVEYFHFFKGYLYRKGNNI
jgi:radical SAM superfamily enzyme YgiQ (UPF0313 family)